MGKNLLSYKDVDRTWMIGTSVKEGPFGIMDSIGVRTMQNIVKIDFADRMNPDIEAALSNLQKMQDQGKLGRESGEGFYKYLNPEYKEEKFIKSDV